MPYSNTDSQLLWLDLETTGLSTLDGKDEIIEIGCILTTQHLDVIDEFTSVVRPSSHAFDDSIRISSCGTCTRRAAYSTSSMQDAP